MFNFIVEMWNFIVELWNMATVDAKIWTILWGILPVLVCIITYLTERGEVQ